MMALMRSASRGQCMRVLRAYTSCVAAAGSLLHVERIYMQMAAPSTFLAQFFFFFFLRVQPVEAHACCGSNRHALIVAAIAQQS